MYRVPFDTHEKSLDLCGFERLYSVTSLALFPLSLGGADFLHAPGAVGAGFSPVGFGDKDRSADRAPFLAHSRYKGLLPVLPLRGRIATRNQAAY